MSQGNQFYQYGYDHYLKAPKRSDSPPAQSQGSSGRSFSGILRRPVVSMAALLGAGALFTGIIIYSYPSSQDDARPVPVIKADLTPIKAMPEDRGGMEIPGRGSTILAEVGQPPSYAESEVKVEDIFARVDHEGVTKEEALEDAMRSSPVASADSAKRDEDDEPQNRSAGDVWGAASADISGGADASSDSGSAVKNLLDLKSEEVASADSVQSAPSLSLPELKEPQSGASQVLQKIGSSDSDGADISELEVEMASAALKRKPRFTASASQKTVSQQSAVARAPKKIHAPAQSPETLDFVRSVLKSKADEMNDVQPAAGAASAVGTAVSSGGYFVQLASITDPARAGGEWSKMKSKYSVLSASQFRVQEASLSSGTFYRIQAGPMSKADADSICADLKKAGKPGGCLVVK